MGAFMDEAEYPPSQAEIDEHADEYVGCECEIDWRCPLHAGLPTFIETRYNYDDEPEWAK